MIEIQVVHPDHKLTAKMEALAPIIDEAVDGRKPDA